VPVCPENGSLCSKAGRVTLNIDCLFSKKGEQADSSYPGRKTELVGSRLHPTVKPQNFGSYSRQQLRHGDSRANSTCKAVAKMLP
jgi:hypothetical protein